MYGAPSENRRMKFNMVSVNTHRVCPAEFVIPTNTDITLPLINKDFSLKSHGGHYLTSIGTIINFWYRISLFITLSVVESFFFYVMSCQKRLLYWNYLPFTGNSMVVMSLLWHCHNCPMFTILGDEKTDCTW